MEREICHWLLDAQNAWKRILVGYKNPWLSSSVMELD
jgi:hypothetical protein